MEGQSKKDQSFSQQRGKKELTLLPDQSKEKGRMARIEKQEESRG
jgi:hypothetical protein